MALSKSSIAFSIMKLGLMTLSIMELGRMTLSIMTLCKMTQHNDF
jgi:hypothetical protein